MQLAVKPLGYPSRRMLSREDLQLIYLQIPKKSEKEDKDNRKRKKDGNFIYKIQQQI